MSDPVYVYDHRGLRVKKESLSSSDIVEPETTPTIVVDSQEEGTVEAENFCPTSDKGVTFCRSLHIQYMCTVGLDLAQPYTCTVHAHVCMAFSMLNFVTCHLVVFQKTYIHKTMVIKV